MPTPALQGASSRRNVHATAVNVGLPEGICGEAKAPDANQFGVRQGCKYIFTTVWSVFAFIFTRSRVLLPVPLASRLHGIDNDRQGTYARGGYAPTPFPHTLRLVSYG